MYVQDAIKWIYMQRPHSTQCRRIRTRICVRLSAVYIFWVLLIMCAVPLVRIFWTFHGFEFYLGPQTFALRKARIYNPPKSWDIRTGIRNKRDHLNCRLRLHYTYIYKLAKSFNTKFFVIRFLHFDVPRYNKWILYHILDMDIILLYRHM